MAARKKKKSAVLQLDRSQIVILLVSVFFLCGVSFFFGRWSRIERPAHSQPPPAASTLSEQDQEEYSFYEMTTRSEEQPSSGEMHPMQDVPAKDTPKAPAAAKNREESRSFAIQVLATADPHRAESLSTALIDDDYPAFVVTTDRPGGPPLYRVRVGVYHSKALAEDVAAALRERGHSTWIVTESSQGRKFAENQH